MIGDLGNCYRLVSYSVAGLLEKEKKNHIRSHYDIGQRVLHPLHSLEVLDARDIHKGGP